MVFLPNYEADLDDSKLTRTGNVPVQPLTSQDPEVQRVLALLPSNPSGVYRGRQDNGYTANLGTARLDYLASARNTFGATFEYTNSTRDDPADSSVFGSKPTTTIQVSAPFYSAFWRSTPTARLTNELRAGASLPSIDMANSLRSTFGFIATLNDPKIQVSQPMMGMDPQGRQDYQRGYQDNATWVVRRQTIQFGGWFQQYQLNTYGNNDGLLDSLTVPRYTVDNIALGTVSEVDQRFNITSPTSGYSSGSTARSRLSAHMLSGYVQDNWKVLGWLTLIIGIRYDYLSPAVENTGTAIIPALTLAGAVTDTGPDSVYFQNLNFAYVSRQQPFYARAFDHVSTNFGLAAKPIEKLPLVVRGGFNVSYIPGELLGDMSIYALRNPFQSFNVSTDLTSPVALANAPVTPTPVLPSSLTLQSLQSFANSYHQEPGTVYAVDPLARVTVPASTVCNLPSGEVKTNTKRVTEVTTMLRIKNRTHARIIPLWLVLLLLPVVLRAQCVSFPANFIPLSTVNYVTAADSAGDHLVVGALAGGVSSVSVLPQPSSTNQMFCDAQVQLAPQQFYSNVYVPTAAEQSGNFSAPVEAGFRPLPPARPTLPHPRPRRFPSP
jgi:hypothetical protein